MAEALPPGSLVIGNKTSHAPFPDCLPFVKAEILTIVRHEGDGKIRAENKFGIQGLINVDKVRPAEDYVYDDWYMKDFTAKMAAILLSNKEYGTFIVRSNSRKPTDLVISVNFHVVMHYSFSKRGSGLEYDGVFYKTVSSFIEQCNKELVLEGYLRFWLKQSDFSLPEVAQCRVSMQGMNLRVVAGNKAIAVDSVVAHSSVCLSIEKGHIYTVLKACRDPRWLVVKDEDEKEGYAPAAVLECYIPEWFHARMEREQADQILNTSCRDGTFLVRERPSKPGWFALSVWCPERVCHVPLMYSNGQFTTGTSAGLPRFESLLDLVDHYRRETMFWAVNGECIRVLFPLSRRESRIPNEIKQMDLRSIEMYLTALTEGKERVRDIRIMVVGHCGAGKTTLTERLMGQPYRQVGGTNGIEIHVRQCKFSVKDGKWSNNRPGSGFFDDESHIERLTRLLESPDDNPKSVLDDFKRLTSRDDSPGSKRNSREIQPGEFYLNPSNNTSSEQLTGANRSRSSSLGSPQYKAAPDLFNSPVSPLVRALNSDDSLSEAESSAYEIDTGDIAKYKFSAGTLKAISEAFGNSRPNSGKHDRVGFITMWDFGGQYIFYSTHQIFLSPRAIYLLVLDLSKDLDDFVEDDDFPLECSDIQGRQVKSFGDFWLRSIHTFCGDVPGQPPVLLVGTHKDKMNCPPEKRDEVADQYFESFRKLIETSPVSSHVQPEQFAIDSTTSDEEFTKLKAAIVTIAKRQHHWNQEVPARWIPLERSLNRMRVIARIVSVGTVIQADAVNEVSIGDEEEIRLFLRYQHAVGGLIYFDDEGLCDSVVLDPQWIIDAFKSIITATKFCKLHSKLRPLWNLLQEKAMLKDELIDEIWGAEKGSEFLRDKGKLLLYLERLDIIAKPKILSKDGQCEDADYYFVPSLLRVKGEKTFSDLPGSLKYSSPLLCFKFNDGFVPPALFHRILGECMSKHPVLSVGGNVQLFNDVGVFKLDEYHCAILSIDNSIINAQVVNMCNEKVKPALCDKFRRFLISQLQDELGRYHQNMPFSECIKCERQDRTSNELLNCRELLKLGKMPCLAHSKPHTVHSENLLGTWYPDYVELPQGKKSSQSWVDDLPLSHRRRLVTNKDLSKISKCLGFNWEFVLIELGLSQATIDQSKMDHPYQTAMQIYDTLCKWKSALGLDATIEALVTAIHETNGVQVNSEIVKNVVDGI